MGGICLLYTARVTRAGARLPCPCPRRLPPGRSAVVDSKASHSSITETSPTAPFLPPPVFRRQEVIRAGREHHRAAAPPPVSSQRLPWRACWRRGWARATSSPGRPQGPDGARGALTGRVWAVLGHRVEVFQARLHARRCARDTRIPLSDSVFRRWGSFCSVFGVVSVDGAAHPRPCSPGSPCPGTHRPLPGIPLPHPPTVVVRTPRPRPLPPTMPGTAARRRRLGRTGATVRGCRRYSSPAVGDVLLSASTTRDAMAPSRQCARPFFPSAAEESSGGGLGSVTTRAPKRASEQ